MTDAQSSSMSPLTFYVSPQGHDAHPGSEAQPFATLRRARDAAREARGDAGGAWTEMFWRDGDAKGLNDELLLARYPIPERPAVHIVLLDGVYRLTEPLKLISLDAGTRERPVVWSAAPGAAPVITGSVTLSGWEPWKNGIWRAPLPSHLPKLVDRHFTTRELFYRGRRQTRSRYPKFDPANPRRGGFLFPRSGDARDPYRGFYLPQDFDRSYAHPDEGELNIAAGHGGWCNNIIPIAHIHPRTGRLSLVRDAIKLAWTPWAMVTHLGPYNRFFIQNMLEDLEQPGEWCLVHRERMIYFKPPDGEAFDPAQVEIPVLGQLLALHGSQHTTFRGITFRGCRQLGDNLHRPGNAGYGAMLAQPDWSYCGEAVLVAWSNHVAFDRCTVDQVGGNGIYFERKSQRCRVTRCTLSHVGVNPIVFIGDRFDHPFACEVSDCHIHDGGDILNYVAGVFCGVSDAIRIEHNHIHHMPHHAVNLGSNGRGRNYVEHNLIEHVTLEIADTGAINCWMDDPCAPGEPSSEFVERAGHVIRHNLIRHVRGCISHPDGRITDDETARGIYLDDGSSNCIVSDNIVVDAHCGLQIHAGRHNLVENNIFIDVLAAIYFCNDPANRRGSGFNRHMLRGNRFTHNILYSRRHPHPHHWAPKEFHDRATLFWFSQTSYDDPDDVMACCDYNVYHFTRSGPLRIDRQVPSDPAGKMEQMSLDQWRQQFGHDVHSAFTDPAFVNLDTGDFTLAPDSPALKLGFRPIDVSNIGIRPE